METRTLQRKRRWRQIIWRRKFEGLAVAAALVVFGISNFRSDSSIGQFSIPQAYAETWVISNSVNELRITPLAAEAVQPKRKKNTYSFSGAYPNADVLVTREPDKLKEEIVLKSPDHPEEFAYRLDAEGLEYKETGAGDIVFYAQGHLGDPRHAKFTLPAPFMQDADGVRSAAIESFIYEETDGLHLKIIPDKEWLAGASYPVTVDPTVEITVLTVHSHPVAGEYWEVEFVTTGTADLAITPADQATIDDMEFTSLLCGEEERAPQIRRGDVIFYPGWTCNNEVATVRHFDKKTGNHHLVFEFGGQTADAYNAVSFTDVTATAGVGNTGGVYGITWEDYDNDGDLDLWIGGIPLYDNDGDGTFTATAKVPTGYAGVWTDAENDGDMDVLASGNGYFYDNQGSGTFTERASAANLVGGNMKNPRALDYNKDGLIDFFFPNDTDNEIRENNGNSPVTFTTRDCGDLNLGCQTGESNGETAAVADVDNDGDTDIWYNDASDGSLYYNDGDGTFTENAAGAGLAIAMGGWQPYYAPVFGDYDNDGWLDLFLGHPTGIESRLYKNDGDGTFTRQDSSAPDANHGHTVGADWGDYDHDGDLDLLLGIDVGANKLYRNDGGGTFTDVAGSLGIQNGTAATKSVSFSDYDNDGDLDIYYGNNSQANVLYRNNLNDSNYLKVKVTGQGAGESPVDGIGSRVELWNSDMSTLLAIREVMGGQGYGDFSPRIQHFGLASSWGGGDGTYTVRVRFTSGAQVIRRGVVPMEESITVGSAHLSQTIEVEEIRNVYFSVGQNTTDHKTGSPTITVTNGVATFSVAQTAANLGVGDKVVYDMFEVYLAEKFSTTRWAVVDDQGSAPANTGGGVYSLTSIAHVFSSLSSAEANIPGAGYLNGTDLTAGASGKNAIVNIPLYYDTGADTTTVDIAGWTTNADHYIKVYTPVNTITEVNQSQRHGGVWDTGAYQLVISNNYGLTISQSNVRVEGLQVQTTGIGDYRALHFGTASVTGVIVDKSIIRGRDDSAYGNAYAITFTANGIEAKITNSVVYGHFTNAFVYDNWNTVTVDIFNSTFYNTENIGRGIERHSGTFTLKNCAVFNTADDFLNSMTIDYCASDDGDGTNAVVPANWSNVFVDYANGDFHLNSSDADLTNAGTNLSSEEFSDDIDGDHRPFGIWDIGADENITKKTVAGADITGLITNGLVGHWTFNGEDMDWSASSAEAIDRSGNGNDGDVIGARAAKGEVGQALLFDGSDDYVSVGDDSSLKPTTAITYAAWIYPRALSNFGSVLEKGNPNTSGYGFLTEADGELCVIIKTSGGAQSGDTNIGVNVNEWSHAAVTYDSTNVKVYINGVATTLKTGDCALQTNTGNITQGATSLTLGMRTGSTLPFNGSTDEVRVYNRVLGEDEIGELYRAGAKKLKANAPTTGRLTSGLVGHWTFNGEDMDWSASSAEARDRSGNNYHGDAVGGARSAKGQVGQALLFDGIDDEVVVNSFWTPNQSSFTAVAWIKTISTDQSILAKQKDGVAASNWNGFNFWVTNLGRLQAIADWSQSGASNYGVVTGDTTAVNNGTWQHVAFVFTGADRTNWKLYVNGNSESFTESGVDLTGNGIDNTVPFRIANRDYTASEFDGSIDEVRIYNRALSPDEVTELYNLGARRFLQD